MTERKSLIVGISGCSSCGKTTLARILRDVFPNTFILHQDDFYKEEKDLPTKNGLLDWDCAGAIDVPGMAESLAYIRQNAAFPPHLESKEDQNSIGECPVSASAIAALKSSVDSSIPPDHPLRTGALSLCLLDGFLLYPPSMSPIHPYLDIKIFLRTTYEKAKMRRERRDGYVTIEGFWSDPPGYVDKIVWPNYVEEHAWMFEGGDVENDFKEDALAKEDIRVEKGVGADRDLESTLRWAADVVLDGLKKSQV